MNKIKKSVNALTAEQSELVAANLDVVKWTILKYININENIVGLGYEDLYQIGCLALCHAATTYNGSVQFDTYAGVVVKNKLIDHCRSVMTKYKHTIPVGEYSQNGFDCNDETFKEIEITDAITALSLAKKRYKGVTLKGIEAIELKIKGYNGREIAELYKVTPNNINAWISRAVSKLRKDSQFMAAFPFV